MILSVTLNPSIDLALFLEKLEVGDTNRVKRVERDAGGKGVNVSRVVSELGGVSTATGFLGGPAGQLVHTVLDIQGVTNDFVEIEGETRTNFSVEDEAGTPPTTFNDRGPTITDAEFRKLCDKVDHLCRYCSWIALGGSLPPGVPTDAYRTLGDIAHRHGVKVMLDADGAAQHEGLKAAPQFIKPNEKEAGRFLGRTIETLEESVQAARDLYEDLSARSSEFGPPIVVISRGGKGAILATDGKVLVGESPKIIPHSSIGSGDSMIAGILWALRNDKSVEIAFQYGLAAGAATATTDGSEIARRPVIEQLFPQATVTPHL